MNSQLWWYLARATGLVAWALATAAVITGLLFATRLTGRRPPRAWTLDLHRFLGGASVVFTGLHITGLVADNYMTFGASDVLVPFASPWKPAAVALGVVALYLLVAVEATSLLMRRLPRRWWRSVHLTSYGVFWLATFHLLSAGTDADHPITRTASLTAVTAVVFLTLVNVLFSRSAVRSRRSDAASSRRAPSAGSPAAVAAGNPPPTRRTSRSIPE